MANESGRAEVFSAFIAPKLPIDIEHEMRELARRYMREAIRYEQAARESEAKANKRGRRILEEASFEFRPGMKNLPTGTSINDVADDRRGKDPVWKAHAGDNRWHLDQSLIESNNALMIMKAIEMGIRL